MIVDFIQYPTATRMIRYTDAGWPIDHLTEQDAIQLLATRNDLVRELAFYKDQVEKLKETK
jgi:hypothetical protein